MKKILVIGAGAIGRGHVPWVFSPLEFQYYYDDINDGLIKKLSRRGHFTSWITLGDHYEPLGVPIERGLPKDPDIVFCAVGPRNFLSLCDRFMGTKVPIVCCENDSRLPRRMREITGNPNVFFAIPDVITSNTAPQRLLDVDRLSVVTEQGVMYIDEGIAPYLSTPRFDTSILLNDADMKQQWMAKLYLHNTPHCVAAYMGWHKGQTYIHEAMAIPKIAHTVRDVLTEMTQMVVAMYQMNENFCQAYADKELARFSNRLLCDPITRVAREPLRKLAISDRLIGAAMLCIQCGITPTAILTGIKYALSYDNEKDPDHHVMKLVKELDPETFIQGVLHVRPEEKLYPMLMEVMRG